VRPYYRLENLKALPAQIISKRTYWLFTIDEKTDTSRKAFEFLEKRPEDSERGGKLTYVIKDAPPIVYAQPIPLQQLNFEIFEKGGEVVFFFACIEYKDLTSGNNRWYRCIIKIQIVDNKFLPEFQYNDNADN
jgi:hypothetical protein